MSGYILALDQGTTSSRAIIYDSSGQTVKMVQKATNLLTPKAGFVEQDAMQIWQTQISCAHDAINQAGLLATDITSIAITNQRETIVVWDKKTGKPLSPAVIWQDRRTEAWCDTLKHASIQTPDGKMSMPNYIQSITGLRIDPYFSASKMVWLLEQNIGNSSNNGSDHNWQDKIRAGDLAIGTVDSWLIFKLTGGVHVTDVTNASRTLLFDIHKMKWSSRLLTQFGLPASVLPEVLASDADFGKTKKGLFAKQIPIHAVLGDQQAALYGQGCLQAGMAKNTYGTGCFMLMNIGNTPRISEHQLLTTVAWQTKTMMTEAKAEQGSLGKLMQSGRRILPPKRQPIYALEGSVFMAGAIVQWLRDNLGLFSRSHDIETLAGSVTDSDSVVLVPAFTGLGAPYWRSNLTASITGMTRGTTKAHIARAALEAIAYQTYDVLTAMQKDSHNPLTELRVDGGACGNDLLMQFQADLLDVPVLRPKDTEVTAKGVAMLAGIKSGLYDNNILNDSWQLDKKFEPKMTADARQYHLQKWHRAIQNTLREDNQSD